MANRRINAIVEEKREALEALCRKHRVKRLALFGSATTDAFDPEHSDLDFVVEYEPQDPSLHADNYFGLLFALEDLFGRPVDLVESQAIRNPFFRKDVDETQVMLYEAA